MYVVCGCRLPLSRAYGRVKLLDETWDDSHTKVSIFHGRRACTDYTARFDVGKLLRRKQKGHQNEIRKLQVKARNESCADEDIETTTGSEAEVEALLVKQEEEEEAATLAEYKDLIQRNKKDTLEFSTQEIYDARQLVAELVRSGDQLEETIERAAKEKQLTNALLVVIRHRLDLARMDKERDAIECLTLLQQRIQTEMSYRAASPALRLLNDLLHLPGQGSQSNATWVQNVGEKMKAAFVPENPHVVFMPSGPQGAQGINQENEKILFRIEFIEEVDELLQKVVKNTPTTLIQGNDPVSLGARLQQEERLRAIEQVKSLRYIAATLKWT